MKLILGLFFMIFMIYQPSVAVDKIHTCFPSSYTKLCHIGHVFYNRSSNIRHIFPQNYTMFRMGDQSWAKAIDSVVEIYDPQLHAELGHPPAVEIPNAELKTLVIPHSLQYANFADNRLETFWVEKGEAEPLLSYLELSENRFSNLTNITVFVNLETVSLAANRIESVNMNVFKNLTKLKTLNLNYNRIAVLSGDHFPSSLTYLGLYGNSLKALNYTALQFPSLKILNIERNELDTIDAARLLLGLPKLQQLRLGRNQLSRDTLLDAISVLKQHNVSYRDETNEVSCYYKDEEIEGVCMFPQPIGKGWFKVAVLCVLTVGIAIIFILTVRWMMIAMHK